jgi:chorismate mutase
MNSNRFRAVRGAVQVRNEVEDINAWTAGLFDRMRSENRLTESDLVSLIFSVTPDITTQNPARALRDTGRAGDLPMMVFQEAVYEDSLPRTIRVLLHCYFDTDRKPRHTYINGAEVLRPDLAQEEE